MARRAKGANGAAANQVNLNGGTIIGVELERFINQGVDSQGNPVGIGEVKVRPTNVTARIATVCLLYTSPSPRDATLSRMPSSA